MDLSFFLNGHLRRRCKDEEIHKSGPRNNREVEETTGNASAFQWRSGICHLWAKDQSSPRLVHLSHPRVSCTAVSSYRHCDGVEWHWRPPWWLPLHVAATGWQVGGGRDALANSVRLLTRCISLAVALDTRRNCTVPATPDENITHAGRRTPTFDAAQTRRTMCTFCEDNLCRFAAVFFFFLL